MSHLYYGLQGLALNDFSGRTGWACPVGSPQPCSVTGDDILRQLGFYGDSLGYAFMGLLLLTVRPRAGSGGRAAVAAREAGRRAGTTPLLPSRASLLTLHPPPDPLQTARIQRSWLPGAAVQETEVSAALGGARQEGGVRRLHIIHTSPFALNSAARARAALSRT